LGGLAVPRIRFPLSVFSDMCACSFWEGNLFERSQSAFLPFGCLLVYQRMNTVEKFLRWLVSTAFMYPLLEPIFELEGIQTMVTALQMPTNAESPHPGQFFVDILVEVVNRVVALIAH
jgi:hypothetical protein